MRLQSRSPTVHLARRRAGRVGHRHAQTVSFARLSFAKRLSQLRRRLEHELRRAGPAQRPARPGGRAGRPAGAAGVSSSEPRSRRERPSVRAQLGGGQPAGGRELRVLRGARDLYDDLLERVLADVARRGVGPACEADGARAGAGRGRFGRRRRPVGGGTGDDVALAVRDVQVGEPRQLLARFDALGAHGRRRCRVRSGRRRDQRRARPGRRRTPATSERSSLIRSGARRITCLRPA